MLSQPVSHRLGQNLLLSTIKMVPNSAVIREKKQRIEVMQGGMGIYQ